jgi:preprotein translocase subunit SecY
MSLGKRRSRVARVLRPTIERVLLWGSLVLGLAVVGSCAASASTSSGIALNVLGGIAFAIILVGAVFLLTTMSRDLRRLRERYVDEDGIGTAPVEPTDNNDVVQTP